MHGTNEPADVAMRQRSPESGDDCPALKMMSTGCERAWRRSVWLLA